MELLRVSVENAALGGASKRNIKAIQIETESHYTFKIGSK